VTCADHFLTSKLFVYKARNGTNLGIFLSSYISVDTRFIARSAPMSLKHHENHTVAFLLFLYIII
jgi:hypothetical protein